MKNICGPLSLCERISSVTIRNCWEIWVQGRPFSTDGSNEPGQHTPFAVCPTDREAASGKASPLSARPHFKPTFQTFWSSDVNKWAFLTNSEELEEEPSDRKSHVFRLPK